MPLPGSRGFEWRTVLGLCVVPASISKDGALIQSVAAAQCGAGAGAGAGAGTGAGAAAGHWLWTRGGQLRWSEGCRKCVQSSGTNQPLQLGFCKVG